MKNHSSIGVGNGHLRLAVFAAAGLLISSLALVGASCTRDSSNPPPNPVPNSPVTSPVKAAGADCETLSKGQTYKFESANYWENELQVLKDQHDMQACAKACADNAECKAATYVDSTVGNGWANSCVLRKAVGARHPESPGTCSWVKP